VTFQRLALHICCIALCILTLVPGLFLDDASASVFSNGRRSKSVVVCRFGDLSKVPGRMFEKFCEYLSEDHAVDLSITYCQLGRACVS